MAGWLRLRGTLQVHPCKLGRAIHGAHAPATGPTPPSTDLRNLSGWHDLLLVGVDPGRHVDPRHAWMLFDELSTIRFRWRFIHAWRGSTRLRKSVRGGAVWVGRTVGAMDGAIEPPWVRALCLRSTASQAPERTAASGWAGLRVYGVSCLPIPPRHPTDCQLLLLLRPLRVPGAARPNPRYLNSCAVMPSGRACSSMCRVMALAPNICSAS